MPACLNIFPEVPITEEWSYLTDILTTHNGTESRISLRGDPRVKVSADFAVVTQEERRELTSYLMTVLDTPGINPIWPYAARITQETSSGASRVYFGPATVQLSDGAPLVLINPTTRACEVMYTTTINSDGANLATNTVNDIDTSWFAVKGMNTLVDNGSGFGWRQITGGMEANFESWVQTPIIRADNAESLTTLDGLPILERTALSGGTEGFEFVREVVDYDVGVKDISTRHSHAQIKGRRTFKVDRIRDATDFDYWAVFFDTIRGSWKPFLISTQLKDMTLASTLVANGTTMSIDQADADTLFHAFSMGSHFEILYSDGTKSRHTISGSTGSGPVTVTFSPNLPNDAKVTSVARISYLLKARASDRIVWTHDHTESKVSFEIRTTDEG